MTKPELRTQFPSERWTAADSGRRPRGSGSDGPRPLRVLLEAPDGADGARLWRCLTDRGYEVSWCPGPQGPPPVWCPLMSGHPCDLVEGSDAVVSALGLDDAACREVLARLADLHPRTTVIVEARRSDAKKHAALVSRYTVVTSPANAEDLTTAVEAAKPSGAAVATVSQ